MRTEVFAVEDTAVQVVWEDGPRGPVEVRAAWNGGSAAQTVLGDGGPGAVVLEGLPPATTVRVTLGDQTVETVTTLAPPPGRILSRFATINDMHIGAVEFGTLRRIWDDDHADPHPERCMRAAIDEAVAWGAEALIVKGDLTKHGRLREWEVVATILGSVGLPMLVIEGNHETKQGAIDGSDFLARHGIDLTVGRAAYLDLPGVRIVAVPTAKLHKGSGEIVDRVSTEAVALVASAPAGAVAVLHHYPQRFRHQTLYPSGIPGPGASRFLDAVASANPATLVLAGHSHRHRRHAHGPVAVAEVGSTKDYPGSWAGYTVHAGGIMQTTRRVMEPSAIRWTTRGRRVLGGVWGVWAPGLRSHRCFSYVWPGRPS